MSYNMLLDREPTDQKLHRVLSQAIEQASQKKKKALKTFSDDIHRQIMVLKKGDDRDAKAG
jgi:hypothetical protein